jgi:purine-binding chemotaxis protein CheW
MKRQQSEPMRKELQSIKSSEVHSRLKSVQELLVQKWEPLPEQRKAILRERAKVLARTPLNQIQAGETIEVVEFLLAHEHYGIESCCVREIHPLKEYTPLPGTPPFVLGIINVRGQILSIIDIKRFFDLPAKGLTDLNKVIILQSDQMTFGILADAILGIRKISITEVRPALPTLTGIREEYLKGIAGECLVLLEAEKMLLDKKIIINEQVES